METNDELNVPDFGSVVRRQRLLAVFAANRFAVTFVCAPPGYGKSVLAAQLAAAEDFTITLWVSAFDEDMCGDEFLVTVAAALSVTKHHQESASTCSRSDALMAIGDVLSKHHGSRTCLVVDGCDHLDSVEAVQELGAVLRRATSPSSSLIVTCRSLPEGGQAHDMRHAWIIDEHDLRFSEDEVEELLRQADGPEVPSGMSQRLRERFGGHPALTCLMLRHSGLDDQVEAPKDLVWYVDRLTSGLSSSVLTLAYAAALLREDDVEVLSACVHSDRFQDLWSEAHSLAPLLVDLNTNAGSRRFRMHGVLGESARRRSTTQLDGVVAENIREAVLEHLRAARSYPRIQAILEADCSGLQRVRWLERCGHDVLRFVGAESLARCIGRVDPALLVSRPELLLLRARALREQERFDEARAEATLVRQLAEAAGDNSMATSAILLVTRLFLDTCELEKAQEALAYLERHGLCALDIPARRLVDAYSAVIEAQAGAMASALTRAERVLGLVRLVDDLGCDEAVFAVNCVASVMGMAAGRWDTAAGLMGRLARRDDLSPLQRVQTRANMAVCYLELGSLAEARALLDQVIADTEAAGMQHLAGYAYGTRSSVKHALQDDRGGIEDYELSDHLHELNDDQYVRVGERLSAAVNRRAIGRREEALTLAEEAQLIVESHGFALELVRHSVTLEIAASILSLNDPWGASRLAKKVLAELGERHAASHVLRGELVLAEAARMQGDVPAAVRLVAANAEYIATGAANWLLALYVRAFPGLLGVLAAAIGAENMPLRMLLMVPTDTLENGIAMAGEALPPSQASVLRRRRGAGEDAAGEPDAGVLSPACYARVFGGLEVRTPLGLVDEGGWRKRKARALFLFLVLRQHQDVPRDVLLEQLWPDMDEEHAKRNFYVTWSTMKRALACGGAPSESKALVQCAGGVCRVTREVRSDLDDFEELLANIRRYSSGDDVSAVRCAALRLIEIYRGELLPGDLYEEWLTEIRERAKHDFCDAMMLAASSVEASGDFDEALLFLRKASAADPWREDVYQATMRCQMSSGQRSRAIETYISCRSRLTEDLGIDPSAETTKLYQAVLAMEDSASAVKAG